MTLIHSHNHVSETNKCELCNETEDVEHYLFKCLKYNVQRVQPFRSTHSMHPLVLIVNINTSTVDDSEV